MAEIDELITQARKTGDLHALADYLRDRPMSPTGFVKTEHGSFGDGYMADRSWLEVGMGVGHRGGLTEEQYGELRSLVGR